jgi:hypothetical protein
MQAGVSVDKRQIASLSWSEVYHEIPSFASARLRQDCANPLAWESQVIGMMKLASLAMTRARPL